MNERIKKLLDQATMDALYATQNAVDLLDNPVTKQQRQLQLENFAELIVRECALTAGLMEHEGRKGIGAQILDNFGVEE